MSLTRFTPGLISSLLTILAITSTLSASPITGRQFIAFTHFNTFEITTLPSECRSSLTSPILLSELDFDELIVSWNITTPPGSSLLVEARPIFNEHSTRFFSLGKWSADDPLAPSLSDLPRSSSGKQSTPDGEVHTDVLVLTRPARSFQIRLSITHRPGRDPTLLKFVGVSLLNSSIAPPLHAETLLAGREVILPVPTRSQLDYPGGGAWCSPTSVSMVLDYWSTVLERSDLIRDVPEVAAAVHDPGWPGTGNWPFNTAYAGSFEGMRAYVTRLGTTSELETWIQTGVPIVASVSYSILKGNPDQRDGHLVVVVGFDKQGNIILNDPGTRISMQKTVARDRFAAAWASSQNTVYIIHPSQLPIPNSPHNHW